MRCAYRLLALLTPFDSSKGTPPAADRADEVVVASTQPPSRHVASTAGAMAGAESPEVRVSVGVIDSDVVRAELPRSASGTDEWRLRSSASAATALGVTALSTDVPAEGVRLVLTPHALFRLRSPATAPPSCVTATRRR